MKSASVVTYIEANPGRTVAQIAKGTGRTDANVRQILANAYGRSAVFADDRIPSRFYPVWYAIPIPLAARPLIEVVRDAVRARLDSARKISGGIT